MKLFKLHKKFGNHWSKYIESFDNRTDNNIKNHFFSYFKKFLRYLNKECIYNNYYNNSIYVLRPKTITMILYSKKLPNNFKTKPEEKVLLNNLLKTYILNDHLNIPKVQYKPISNLIQWIIKLNNFYIKRKSENKKIKKNKQKKKLQKINLKNIKIENNYYLTNENNIIIDKDNSKIIEKPKNNTNINKEELSILNNINSILSQKFKFIF